MENNSFKEYFKQIFENILSEDDSTDSRDIISLRRKGAAIEFQVAKKREDQIKDKLKKAKDKLSAELTGGTLEEEESNQSSIDSSRADVSSLEKELSAAKARTKAKKAELDAVNRLRENTLWFNEQAPVTPSTNDYVVTQAQDANNNDFKKMIEVRKTINRLSQKFNNDLNAILNYLRHSNLDIEQSEYDVFTRIRRLFLIGKEKIKKYAQLPEEPDEWDYEYFSKSLDKQIEAYDLLYKNKEERKYWYAVKYYLMSDNDFVIDPFWQNIFNEDRIEKGESVYKKEDELTKEYKFFVDDILNSNDILSIFNAMKINNLYEAIDKTSDINTLHIKSHTKDKTIIWFKVNSKMQFYFKVENLPIVGNSITYGSNDSDFIKGRKQLLKRKDSDKPTQMTLDLKESQLSIPPITKTEISKIISTRLCAFFSFKYKADKKYNPLNKKQLDLTNDYLQLFQKNETLMKSLNDFILTWVKFTNRVYKIKSDIITDASILGKNLVTMTNYKGTKFFIDK